MLAKKDYNSLIKNSTDWVPVSMAPSKSTRRYNELREAYGSFGVYQIATDDHLPKEYIDQHIVYIGKSTDVSLRVCNIKAPKGNHNCRTYISSKNIDITKVYYRTLYTNPGDEAELERLLHEDMESKFGYRFKWREASAGSDGALVRILDAIDNIESISELRTISKYIDDIVVKKYLESWKEEE